MMGKPEVTVASTAFKRFELQSADFECYGDFSPSNRKGANLATVLSIQGIRV
jgi:hypothetical protein